MKLLTTINGFDAALKDFEESKSNSILYERDQELNWVPCYRHSPTNFEDKLSILRLIYRGNLAKKEPSS